jgi:CBS domain-containing protein
MTTVQDIMTTELTTVPMSAPIEQAARLMRDEDIGDVIVINDEGALVGLVTDRDITIRAIADGRNPSDTAVREICSADLVTATPTEDVSEVAELMRSQAVRRIPVVDGDRPVGIVSLGDLAVDREPDSALAEISAEDPDR